MSDKEKQEVYQAGINVAVDEIVSKAFSLLSKAAQKELIMELVKRFAK